MSGGPLYPEFTVPLTSKETFGYTHIGDGTEAAYTSGMGVGASLSADATWHIAFQMPPSLPAGTCKLVVDAFADAVTGDIDFNPKCASVAVGEDPSSVSKTAKGTSTITWATNEDDTIQQAKVILDADTVVAAEKIYMDLVFESTSDLAVISTWIAYIIWE